MPKANCPGRDALSAYLARKLPDQQTEQLERHVDTCADCQAVIATLDQPDDDFVLAVRRSLSAPPFVIDDECRQAVARIQALIPIDAAPDLLGIPPSLPVPTAATVPSRDQALTEAAPPELKRLRGYELVAKLGEGGMGAVYKALQPHLDRWVAVKVMPADRLRDARAVARFQREIKTFPL